VQEQVDAATSKLTARNRRQRDAEQDSAADPSPEVQALHRVFREMGRKQRATRRQAGLPPFPAVRDAALAFRRAPTFAALLGVAGSLEEVGLLS
jgi:hypothetical protein